MKKVLFSIFILVGLFCCYTSISNASDDNVTESLSITWGLNQAGNGGYTQIDNLDMSCSRGDHFVIIGSFSLDENYYKPRYYITTRDAIVKYIRSGTDVSFEDYWSGSDGTERYHEAGTGTFTSVHSTGTISDVRDSDTNLWDCTGVKNIASSPATINGYRLVNLRWTNISTTYKEPWFNDCVDLPTFAHNLSIGMYEDRTANDYPFLQNVPSTVDFWQATNFSFSSLESELLRNELFNYYSSGEVSDTTLWDTRSLYKSWSIEDTYDKPSSSVIPAPVFQNVYSYDSTGYISSLHFHLENFDAYSKLWSDMFESANDINSYSLEYVYRYGYFQDFEPLDKQTVIDGFKAQSFGGYNPTFTDWQHGSMSLVDGQFINFYGNDDSESILNYKYIKPLMPDFSNYSSKFSSHDDKLCFNNQVLKRFNTTLFHKYSQIDFAVRVVCSGGYSKWYVYHYNSLDAVKLSGDNYGVTLGNGSDDYYTADDYYNDDSDNEKHGNHQTDNDSESSSSSSKGLISWLFDKIGFGRLGDALSSMFNSIVGLFRSLIDGIGSIPSFLGQVFTWLPNWFSVLFSCSLGLVILFRIIGR